MPNPSLQNFSCSKTKFREGINKYVFGIGKKFAKPIQEYVSMYDISGLQKHFIFIAVLAVCCRPATTLRYIFLCMLLPLLQFTGIIQIVNCKRFDQAVLHERIDTIVCILNLVQEKDW